MNLCKILNKIISDILLLNMILFPLTYLLISNFRLKWQCEISVQNSKRFIQILDDLQWQEILFLQIGDKKFKTTL